MRLLKACVIVLLLLPGFSALASAATNAEGTGTAAGEAKLRVPGAVLVEVEGFVDPEGDIPCVGKSFSNIWQYKYYSGATAEWLIVNTCGNNFINASKHFPRAIAEEPTKALPAYFADSRAVLEMLQREKVFTGAGSARDRGILLTASYLPPKDGRPAGCYWTVSQDKVKILADCEGKKHWGTGKAAPAGQVSVKALKGDDTAGKYVKLAADTVRRKQQGARLMLIEALVDRSGSAKCLIPDDGWTYVFSSPNSTNMTFGGCKNKTSLENVDFTGRTGNFRGFEPLPLSFKDSDFVLSKTPSACAAGHSTISMKLRRFKTETSPVSGFNLLWTVDCGALRYYLDGYTGKYLGPGKK